MQEDTGLLIDWRRQRALSILPSSTPLDVCSCRVGEAHRLPLGLLLALPLPLGLLLALPRVVLFRRPPQLFLVLPRPLVLRVALLSGVLRLGLFLQLGLVFLLPLIVQGILDRRYAALRKLCLPRLDLIVKCTQRHRVFVGHSLRPRSDWAAASRRQASARSRGVTRP